MSLRRPSALTYRVESIPAGVSKDQLKKDYFSSEDQKYIEVRSLVPAVDSTDSETGDYTATVLFRPNEPRPDGLVALDRSIQVDKDFCGFTPLYVPTAKDGPITADIIAVTGLAGHAFGSWAHSEEQMWLRDYLPNDIRHARILTYGYDSSLQDDPSTSILEDHTSKFIFRLADIRAEGKCETRPIIFIGHSLGCLIIKKAMIDAESHGVPGFPVRQIVFLGAPHRGLDISALRTMVEGEATEQMILELKSGSPTLGHLNQNFIKFASGIEILTCFERKPTKSVIKNAGKWEREGPLVLMVTPESAKLYYSNEKRVPADCDHSQLAKIRRGQGGIYPDIRTAIKKIVVRADPIGPITRSVLARPVTPEADADSLNVIDTLDSKSYLDSLRTLVSDSNLSAFYPSNSPHLSEIARKALALKQDKNDWLSDPKELYKLIHLSLYKTIIYCDDSASMARSGIFRGGINRARIQELIVPRMTRICTRLRNNESGVDIQFINGAGVSCANESMVAESLSRSYPHGDTPLVKTLTAKILYRIQNDISYHHVRRTQPSHIIIITDGRPEGGGNEDINTFEQELSRCADILSANELPKHGVIVHICRVGNNQMAKKYYAELYDKHDRNSIPLFVKANELDDGPLHESDEILDKWLLDLLSVPIIEAFSRVKS